MTYFKKFLNYLPYIIVLLLIALIPSCNLPELINSTKTGKFIIFSYAVLILAGPFLLRWIFTASFISFKFTLLDILLFVFFLYITLNRYWFQPVYGFSIRYYELVGLVLLYCILRQFSSTSYPYLFLAIIIAGTLQAVYGNLQLYGFYRSYHGAFRMTGSFFNPGPYAGYLASAFPIALGMYLFRKQHTAEDHSEASHGSIGVGTKRDRIIKKIARLSFTAIPLIGIITTLLVVPASQSRAAWLAIAISSFFLYAIRFDLQKTLVKYLNTTAKKILALVVGISIVLSATAGVYFFKKDSAYGRLLVWKISADIIKDKPLLGHGFDRFKSEYMHYQADYFRNSQTEKEVMAADNAYYAFNEFVQLAVEGGVTGLILLAIILVVLFKSKKDQKDHNPYVIIAKAGIISVLVFGCFSYPSHILPISMNFILFISIAAHDQINFSYTLKNYSNQFISTGIKASVAFCLFIIVYAAGGTVTTLYNGYRTWNKGFGLYQGGSQAQGLYEYTKVYPVFNKDGDFLIYYAQALAVTGDHEKALKILDRCQEQTDTPVVQFFFGYCFQELKKIDEAKKSYWQAWYMLPNRFYPKYLLAKLYVESGEKEKAKEIAKELINKPAKVNSSAVEEIRTEMKRILEES